MIPIDFKQCQAEIREGSFMTLGPRRFIRCNSATTHVARERNPGPDGERGAMGLCEQCAKVLETQHADVEIVLVEDYRP